MRATSLVALEREYKSEEKNESLVQKQSLTIERMFASHKDPLLRSETNRGLCWTKSISQQCNGRNVE
jgi:hypothetical protein